MALIRLVEIDTIPTTWKLNLSSQPRAALHPTKAGCFWHGSTAVQAGEANTVGDWLTAILFVPICQSAGIVGASSSVSGENAISRWECCHINRADSTVEVVDDSPIMRHFFKEAIGVSVVELRRPVGTLVLLDAARGTVRCLKAFVC